MQESALISLPARPRFCEEFARSLLPRLVIVAPSSSVLAPLVTEATLRSPIALPRLELVAHTLATMATSSMVLVLSTVAAAPHVLVTAILSEFAVSGGIELIASLRWSLVVEVAPIISS